MKSKLIVDICPIFVVLNVDLKYKRSHQSLFIITIIIHMMSNRVR